ncbi:MAG TPA: hypothetical protein P5309_00045 [Syntrophomonadaceae bacterium]|nr:hypothetical protein [Syntrophomonadaceae bacterium]
MNNIESLEKLFATWEKTTEQLWDFASQAIGSMAWNPDQLEKYFQNSLEQGLKAHEDSSKLVGEYITQLKNNQLYFQKMMEESVIEATKNFEIPRLDYFEDFNKK